MNDAGYDAGMRALLLLVPVLLSCSTHRVSDDVPVPKMPEFLSYEDSRMWAKDTSPDPVATALRRWLSELGSHDSHSGDVTYDVVCMPYDEWKPIRVFVSRANTSTQR